MFNVGQTVYSEDVFLEWDNPMVVIEGDHICSCGCGANVITCQGKSGKRYEDCSCAWEDEGVYESDEDLLSDYLYDYPKTEG